MSEGDFGTSVCMHRKNESGQKRTRELIVFFISESKHENTRAKTGLLIILS